MAIHNTRTANAISTIHSGECRMACQRDCGGRCVVESGVKRAGEVGQALRTTKIVS